MSISSTTAVAFLGFLIGACGSSTSGSGTSPSGGEDAAGGAGAAALPELDPPWTEPPPPDEAAAAAAVTAIEEEAKAALGEADVATLDADAKAAGDGAAGYAAAAITYASDLRLGAARYLLARAWALEPGPAPLVTLSALLGQAGQDDDAVLLARRALATVPEDAPDDVRFGRLRAFAWNNLGYALAAKGEAAGALHAYHQAQALTPLDPAYETGLAVAYHALGAHALAALHAQRSSALREALDPGAVPGKADEPVEPHDNPGADWTAFLAEVIKTEGSMSAEWVAKLVSAAPAWPAVGSTLAGFRVEGKNAEGRVVLSRPPFLTHKNGHVDAQYFVCTEGDGGPVLEVKCPLIDENPILPGIPIDTQGIMQAGTNCSNYISRMLDPEIVPLVIDDGSDPKATALGTAGVLSMAFQLAQSTWSSPWRSAYVAEQCTIWSGMLPEFNDAKAVVEEGCSCNCETDLGCAKCWENYVKACKTMLKLQRAGGDRDIAQALTDDIGWASNWRFFQSVMPALWAVGTGKTACDSECAKQSGSLMTLGAIIGVAPGLIGGRFPEELAEDHDKPPRQFAACMAKVPTVCGGSGAADPSKSQCVCWGVGPFKLCLLADGTVEVTGTALLKVGLRTNLKKKSPSLQIGIGVGVSKNLGPVSVDASLTTWFDTHSAKWSKGFFSTGGKLSISGGKFGLGDCASYSATAAPADQADLKSSAIQVVHGSPGAE